MPVPCCCFAHAGLPEGRPCGSASDGTHTHARARTHTQGANSQPSKFYYGRKDDTAWNHDLCWKSVITGEHDLAHEYSHRLRPSELHVASNQHDIFLSCDEPDLPLCSQIHAWIRRMG